MLQSKMKIWSKKSVILLTASVLAISLLSGCAKKGSSEVIATYKDNGTITRSEFDSFVNVNVMFQPNLSSYISDPAFQHDILNQLIVYKIFAAKADEKTKADADQHAAAQMDQFKSILNAQEGGLDKQLKDAKISITDLENTVKLTVTAMFSADNNVTDQDLQNAYNEHLSADPHSFDLTSVRHILISTTDPSDPSGTKAIRTDEEAKTIADEVQGKLKNGEDFAALASQYSEDPGSKDNGGLMENLTYYDLQGFVPEFTDATLALPVNQVSEPVKSTFGYHIIRVDSRTTETLKFLCAV